MNGSGFSAGVTRRIRFGVVILILGLVIFVLGIKPGLFGLDRSPILGFVQIAVFLVGLAGICLGGYLAINALWIGREKSISADVGLRLVSTGYVASVASGMADVFGFGNHPFPKIPYFGAWQANGVLIGMMIIAVGFLLLMPRPQKIATTGHT